MPAGVALSTSERCQADEPGIFAHDRYIQYHEATYYSWWSQKEYATMAFVIQYSINQMKPSTVLRIAIIHRAGHESPVAYSSAQVQYPNILVEWSKTM